MAVILRDGSTVEDRRLDRIRSATTEHIEKYPLTTATLPSAATAMVIGVNWYSGFDQPQRITVRGRERWAIGQGDIGRIRGGHAVCLRHWDLRDSVGWWRFYDQGVEGRCVEFACLRAMSLHNRRRYDITSRWHYHEMQRTDEWAGGSYVGAVPQYEGTSVRAGLEVMRAHGAIPALHRGRPVAPEQAGSMVKPGDGISAYRWATDWQTVRAALGVPDWLPGVPMLNSWGTGYPREVLLLDAAGERILREDGEFGMVTDL
jgi:hypothetical protein